MSYASAAGGGGGGAVGGLSAASAAEFDEGVAKLKSLVEETRALVQRNQQLTSQSHENAMVKEELDALGAGEGVFKLHGKVLVRQDVAEAQSTVASRLKLIGGEITKTERAIKDAMARQDELRGKLQVMAAARNAAQAQAAQAAGSS